jgi:hypothetical protein
VDAGVEGVGGLQRNCVVKSDPHEGLDKGTYLAGAVTCLTIAQPYSRSLSSETLSPLTLVSMPACCHLARPSFTHLKPHVATAHPPQATPDPVRSRKLRWGGLRLGSLLARSRHTHSSACGRALVIARCLASSAVVCATLSLPSRKATRSGRVVLLVGRACSGQAGACSGRECGATQSLLLMRGTLGGADACVLESSHVCRVLKGRPLVRSM